MAGQLLWGWDDTNKVWIKLQVDTNGYVKVDMSNINLNDLADVSVAAPADDDLFYYNNATSLWKSRKLVDADLSAAAQDAIAKRHTRGTDTTLGTLTANVNFATYKAIAMACDSGATVPASPVAGQWFLHTPTGRNVLMQYDGSNWIAIISLGTMTMYVDSSDGTDAIDKGTAVDSNAFATVQYAIDRITGSFGGNITININGETYAENIIIGGKTPTGNYTIALQGATPTVLDSQDVGASAQGSVFNVTPKVYTTITRKAGVWVANEYQNKWVRMTSGAADGEYFIIDSHTTTVLTLVGRFDAGAPAVDDTFDIEEPATQISSFTLEGGQINVRFHDIDWYAIAISTNYVPFPLANECELHRCNLEGSGLTSLWATGASIVEFDACYSHNIRYLVRAGSFITWIASKVMVGRYGRCIQADSAGTISLASTVIDANSVGGSRAVYVAGLGYAIGNAAPKRSGVSLTSNIVRNAATGVDAVLNGVGNVFVPADDTYVTFVNNTADTATATGGQIT